MNATPERRTDADARRAGDANLREHAGLLRLVANSVPAMMAFYESDTMRCLFANASYARTFGFSEQTILGRTLEEIVGKDTMAVIEPNVRMILDEHKPSRYERRLVTADGPRWIEGQLIPHFAPDARLLGAFVLITDITRHREAEAALRESEERLAKFMDASAEGIVFHKGGVITDANGPAHTLLGLALADMIGHHTTEFLPPDQVPRSLEIMRAGAEIAFESAVLHRDGTRIPVEFIVRSIERRGEAQRMVIVRDIRDREAARTRIHHLAHHDPLTDLLNRNAFMERLESLMASGRAGDARGALIFIDLDHFKRVNDSLGHVAGDVLLQTLAQRLVSLLRADDLVARFGGDEFMVLLPGVGSPEGVTDVADKLLAALAAPVVLDGRPISVTPTLGIALYPLHTRTPAELVKNADAAMYQAKREGRATWRVYDPALGARALAAMELETQLTHAVAREEFVLHYQPQVDAHSGRVTGCEALIRWRHPTRGLVEPDQFVPLAEELRLIVPIGRWVLREATQAARRWADAGHPLPVSVNLSSLQFRERDFAIGIGEVLREAGLPGSMLEIEITERMLMDDLPAVRATLAEVKALGVRVAIDDFGTGYSSLGTLNQLPIDRIKIDRSFVHGLPAHAGNAGIARAIVTLAAALGMEVIAEGVETEAQRDFLFGLGCTQLQGHLFGAPSEQLRW
jgi:diguanylate cyclase (GGDEF)-like protein/PAS domain S-box-containing protein